jgi:hypothetical protein
LGPAEAELFMGLHSSARRNIRAVDKKPVSIRPIRDPDYAGRMRELLCKSFARTGKNAPRLDWARLIGFSERHPDLSRIVGLFREGAQGPEALLAYTWGCFHGDCAHYSVGASARPDDLRMPLTYGLMWDLIVWAKTGGAKVFDLGGITGAPVGAEGAVAGIARFKRYFASDEKQVGAEFVLEPNPALGSMQRAVGSAGRWAVERLAGLGRS